MIKRQKLIRKMEFLTQRRRKSNSITLFSCLIFNPNELSNANPNFSFKGWIFMMNMNQLNRMVYCSPFNLELTSCIYILLKSLPKHPKKSPKKRSPCWSRIQNEEINLGNKWPENLNDRPGQKSWFCRCNWGWEIVWLKNWAVSQFKQILVILS